MSFSKPFVSRLCRRSMISKETIHTSHFPLNSIRSRPQSIYSIRQFFSINTQQINTLNQKQLTFSPVLRRSVGNITRPRVPPSQKERNRNQAFYVGTVLVLTLGASYASVPLYRLFCTATGFGGTPNTDASKTTADRLVPLSEHKRIRVRFSSNVSDSLSWTFKPQQKEVWVLPGETALAFYTATNNSDEDVIGMATYNVTPQQVGQYFNKIQCFCFEEQKLKAGESIDMPVFFYIDPDFAEDPLMRDVSNVVLSYVFFKAK